MNLRKLPCLLLVITVILYHFSSAQSTVEAYPTNWWVKMKNNNLQLMLHYPNIATDATVSLSYKGVELVKTNKVENPNYLFLDLKIYNTAKPGMMKIKIHQSGNEYEVSYELKERRTGNGTEFAQGVRSSDLIYLLMPDRFSNGDAANDYPTGLKDTLSNRDSLFLYHGGDIQGVINHLDYLQNLGVTSLWMTPVLENDMPLAVERGSLRSFYHGYAITNHYKINPHFGDEETYKKLSDELHKRRMKLIQDAVYNHAGLYHFTVQDLPMKDWLHQWPAFTHPNYRDQTHFDPYAAPIDKKLETDGWFTDQMPDLNQSNPYVANYLIQNAIWCTETFGLDAWRIDTYIYCDLNFMNRCNQALIDEYPNITMFGEAWVNSTVSEAYFTRNTINTPFKSNLIGVTDFQTLFAGIMPALKQEDGGNSLYQTLSNDILYENPMNNVIFLDNHDMTRFYSALNEDTTKLKIGLAWLMTERGIPQMYYGTEILMKGVSDPDALVRMDFPGGFQGDTKNAFTGQGMNADELSILNYTRTLANFRKSSSAITKGKLMQYVPDDGLYVYFRYDTAQTIMCVMNLNNNSKEIFFSNYVERTKGFTSGRNVVTGETVSNPFTIPGKKMWVLELQK